MKDELRTQIHRAFDNVSVPARVEDVLLPRYTGDDSYEMAKAFVGRSWRDLPVQELFYHRESLATLNALAYRAYLPAYLATDDLFDKYGADLRSYLLSTLKHWPHQKSEHLESKWDTLEAGEILRDW